jgi:acyl carrier protein
MSDRSPDEKGMTTMMDQSPSAILELVRTHLREELSLANDPLDENEQLDLLPGADSVQIMRVVARLETDLDVEFDDDAIRAASTIADLVKLISATLEAEWQA